VTTILVVDDERAMSRGLTRAILLRHPDFRVLSATSGGEAIKLLEEQSVDLVVTDLQMHDGDGFGLLAWLISQRPSVLAFAMSGFCDEGVQARLNALGAIECFPKPIEIDTLLTRISESLTASMRGHVNNVGLASFLQLIELEQKTCTLEVRHQQRRGTLYLRKGELIDARTDELRGEAAAYAIVDWLTVDLTIEGSCNTAERTIWKPAHFVLMEAMRLRDEATRARGPTPCEKPSRPAQDPFAEKSTSEHMMLPTATPTKRSFGRLQAPAAALVLAVIDLETGSVIASEGGAHMEIGELARSAHAIVRQESTTLKLASSSGEPIEELVVVTSSRGELIRPMPGENQLVLLVVDLNQTNLVMARHELARWIADYTTADKS
jgi:DNA-binding response OmpR family regulator